MQSCVIKYRLLNGKIIQTLNAFPVIIKQSFFRSASVTLWGWPGNYLPHPAVFLFPFYRSLCFIHLFIFYFWVFFCLPFPAPGGGLMFWDRSSSEHYLGESTSFLYFALPSPARSDTSVGYRHVLWDPPHCPNHSLHNCAPGVLAFLLDYLILQNVGRKVFPKRR
jgi:hypothetical protein